MWPALEVPAPLVHVAAGQEYECAVHDAGEILCWGSSGPTMDDGRLGYREVRVSPQLVVTAVDDPFVRVAANRHTCGVTVAGDVWCWGPNYHGSLGLGHLEPIGDDERPADAGHVELGAAVDDVVVGFDYTCARVVDGSVRCWGRAHNLGVATACPLKGGCADHPDCCIGDDETAAAARTVPLPTSVKMLASSSSTVCAVLVDGTIYCWGTQPRQVALGEPAASIAVGPWHTCAVLERGALRCWGDNRYGQLGYGHTQNVGGEVALQNLPDVDVGGHVVAVGVGAHHTCAMLDDGAVRCWGSGPGTISGRDRDITGCTVTRPNPNANAGAVCEPAFIQEFGCSAAAHCCLGDDEYPAELPFVPLD